MIAKKTIGKLIAVLLILTILTFILVGENGFWFWAELKNQNEQLLDDIDKLNQEKINILEEINNIEKKSFYIEKIARENLQMADPKDHIFLIVK